MVKLFAMVGMPGSGKSTKAQQLAEAHNALIFSTDAYRKKLFNDENYQGNKELLFTTLYKDMHEALSNGINCIMDATNMTRKSRLAIFNQTKGIADVQYIAYVMRTPHSECIFRDSLRERTVGKEVIDKFYLSFQFPQVFEGFHRVLIDDLFNHSVDAKLYLEKLYEDMTGFEQGNPHHIFDLFTHCQKLAENYYRDREGHVAGLYHDIGKLYTKSYDDKGVAHYYGHDGVGTYEFLHTIEFWIESGFSQEEIYEIIFLINYHMKAHKDLRGEKAAQKYKKIFGEERYKKLIEFADYDMRASGTYDQYAKIKARRESDGE